GPRRACGVAPRGAPVGGPWSASDPGAHHLGSGRRAHRPEWVIPHHGGTDVARGSAVAPDLVDVEGSRFPDLVHADAARVAPVRTVLVHVTQQLMFVRAPFAVVGAQEDD